MTLPTKFRRLKLWIVIIPLALILLGTASNQAVLIANHDKFPVMFNGVNGSGIEVGQMFHGDDVHCMMGPSTHLNFLADIFDFHDGLYSIGDGLLYIGLWLWQYAPAVWIFTLCSLVLKGKDEPLKPTTQYINGPSIGLPRLGGQNLGIGTVTSPSLNRTYLQPLQNKNPSMRVC